MGEAITRVAKVAQTRCRDISIARASLLCGLSGIWLNSWCLVQVSNVQNGRRGNDPPLIQIPDVLRISIAFKATLTVRVEARLARGDVQGTPCLRAVGCEETPFVNIKYCRSEK